MTQAQTKVKDEGFWRDFATMADYFGRGISSLQSFVGVSSRDLFYALGQTLGKGAAEKLRSRNLSGVLTEISGVWDRLSIGKVVVEEARPLTLTISDCQVCGQLPGTGDMYECAFHEGFFKGLLSARLGREVNLWQETNYEGTSGTWCRRFVTDIQV